MTLREFVEKEIRSGVISDFEDFKSSLEALYFDCEEVDSYECDDYLDHDVEWAEVRINYNRDYTTALYVIEIN